MLEDMLNVQRDVHSSCNSSIVNINYLVYICKIWTVVTMVVKMCYFELLVS
jgi:hypothetical protein